VCDAASEQYNSYFDSEHTKRVVTAALWSLFAADALAAPTHWFYGGFRQVQRHYGSAGITGYTKPVYHLPGSILNKSDLSGGGRSSWSTTSKKKTIIGHVINHGKQDLWAPDKQIHYHATLQAGENTLEAQLARVLMKSISENGGRFDADHFRNAYIQFMTTPGTHNDTYASTCHRMFFANLIYHKLPPEQCPDNDGHNVDTVDGLVLPTITALAVAARPDGTIEQAAEQAAATAAVTRKSAPLEQYAAAWGELVYRVVRGNDEDRRVRQAAETFAQQLRLRRPVGTGRNAVTACYLDSSVPALLDELVRYSSPHEKKKGDRVFVWDALLDNANTGGENVHRGSCLGAVLGANAAAAGDQFGPEQELRIKELYDYDSLQKEIQTFVEATTTSAKI
jgi:hypothetical protein